MKGKEESLAWLLNLIGDFQPGELQQPNMRLMRSEQFGQLKQNDEILSQQINTYSVEKGEFCLMKFLLLPNILIMTTEQQKTQNSLMVPQNKLSVEDNAQFLILSNCTITKKAFGMILSNSIGNTYLFFSNFLIHRNWYKQLKQYCKLTGFLEKYKLGEKLQPGFYTCMKKKNQTQHTVQIYKIDDFEQCLELEEAVHNEIHILRSIKHQSLLELKRVYENQKYLFIVYEFYKGESLFKLFNSGLQLHEVQIASVIFFQFIYDLQIVYQTLQLVKFLNQHQFYHGSINPQNILINTQHQMLQITVINLSFKEYKVNDKLDWILNRAVENFLAPEIYEGIAPSIQSDLYAVGCILYFMCFYEPKKYQLSGDDRDFYQIQTVCFCKKKNFQLVMVNSRVKSFLIIIMKRIIKYYSSLCQLGGFTQEIVRTRLKQISILSYQKAKRMTIKEATKHYWFVNVKNKIKSMKHDRKRKKPLPSLRTIIELREQSEMDIRMTIIQQQSGINVIGSRINGAGTQIQSQTVQSGLNHMQRRKSWLPNNQTQIKQTNENEYDVPDDPELNLHVRKFNDLFTKSGTKAYDTTYSRKTNNQSFL